MLLLLLIVGCSKEPINIETLVERDDVFYTKDTNKPYSGAVFSLHKDGQKWEEGTFKDGKMDGKWTHWDDNGSCLFETTYKDGKVIDFNAFSQSSKAGKELKNASKK